MEPSKRIDGLIDELGDWRGRMVRDLRELINSSAPELSEDWKWDTPVWTHNGNVVSIGAFKEHIKVNFFKGASLPDPKGLFNSGLEAKRTRSIDLHEGDAIDKRALGELIRKAAASNKK